MPQPPRIYRRLPGTRRSLFRRATLWLGPDHILSVDSHRFSEEYKRYYLKDIQAIVLQQAGGLSPLSPVIDAIVILGLVAVLLLRYHSPWVSLPGALLLASFVLVKVRGPLCTCQVITAVSRDRLPALCRLRAAKKTLRILRPLIEEAQGALAPQVAAPEER